MLTLATRYRKFKLAFLFSLLIPLVLPFNTRAEILYQVQLPDRSLWILGTIHLAAKSSTELSDKAKHSISTSDRLWMEITPEELNLSAEMLFEQGLHDFPYLREQLPEELWAELAALIARVGLAPSIVQRMEPWLVEYLVMVMWLQREGFKTSLGIDYQVMRYAALNSMTVSGLESAHDQVTALEKARLGVDPEQHVKEILAQFHSISQELAELERGWQEGDLDYIWQQVEQSLSAQSQRVLLEARNKLWFERLQQAVKKDEQHFVAVGAAHLAGEQGLLALFERAGALITKH
ncbi:hypothetical protein CWE15_01045 [Aliidiomarina taiwanensis]|uniref:TraB/GumN family protein n=1 Tax=Aliidiomarina taiwanensis TaxID=946228 RepID=A0A432X8V4_9GAMM|nr:TraB/GumN family protein [Aliidiomarina taiwanensis]RUO43817.1 hypothetical protein CWE15_01045 [Aliidiomarina taiwanensis]